MTKECPNCTTRNTEVVHSERYSDEIYETRVCRECPCEWDVVFGNPIVENAEVYDK